MKTAGIIGGLEFLGCHIALKFLAENYRVKIPGKNIQKSYSTPNIPGLLANQHIEICDPFDGGSENLRHFVSNCDIIVHSGVPHELAVMSNGSKLFIPLITKTSELLKMIKETASVKKVVFITSPAIYNNIYEGSATTAKSNGNSKFLNKAKFHAQQVSQSLLENFSANFFEVVIVAPVEIKDNVIVSNSVNTSTGFQFLFKNKIAQDPVLQKIFKRDILQTVVTPDNLPDVVYNYADGQSEEKFFKENQLAVF